MLKRELAAVYHFKSRFLKQKTEAMSPWSRPEPSKVSAKYMANTSFPSHVLSPVRMELDECFISFNAEKGLHDLFYRGNRNLRASGKICSTHGGNHMHIRFRRTETGQNMETQVRSDIQASGEKKEYSQNHVDRVIPVSLKRLKWIPVAAYTALPLSRSGVPPYLRKTPFNKL